jgi:hypothetical protein
MGNNIADIHIKTLSRLTVVLLSLLFCLSATPQVASAQPALLDAGMSSTQMEWAFDRDVSGANQDVKFWMRVQRQGNLSRFGTFDYYFRIQVFRPDSVAVWDTQYGFNEEGYSDQTFTFPIFFYERSPDRQSPAFGVWKIRITMVEKDSRREVAVREYAVAFTDGKKPTPAAIRSSTGSSKPFPVPIFTYEKWRLQDWGIGIYDEVSTGSNTYDKDIRPLEVRDTFSIQEVANAWQKGHKFAAYLAGPPTSTYVNSNNAPLYLFGYRLWRPDGDIDGLNPQYRGSLYCNNPGALLFPFDLRKPGRYRIEYLIRQRDRNSWEEASWVLIGGIDFTLTE